MTKRLFFAGLNFVLLTSALPAFAQGTATGPVIGRGMPSGRSAKMAARLKYAPPNNYLKHYLGDDRYKIAGGVWKVVSTQLDTYYHRPTCPNILRQHADIVLGFSHSKDAEEAGYRADPVCQPKEIAVVYGQLGGSVTDYVSSATRLTLADGSSSIILPTGWRRVESHAGERGLYRFKRDVFQRKGGRGKVEIVVGTFPNGINAEPYLELLFGGKSKKADSRQSTFGGQLAEMQKGMDAMGGGGSASAGFFGDGKKGRWGGATARIFDLSNSSTLLGRSRISQARSGMLPFTMIFGAKGSKALTFIDTDGTRGAKTIRDSFRMQ